MKKNNPKKQQQNRTVLEALPELVNGITDKGKDGCYIRMGDSNPVFDFILSRLKKGKL